MPTRKNRLHHVILAGEAHRKKASATATGAPTGAPTDPPRGGNHSDTLNMENLGLGDRVNRPDAPNAHDPYDSDDDDLFNPPPTHYPPPPPRRGGEWVPGADGLYKHAHFVYARPYRSRIYYETRDLVGLATRLYPPQVSPPPLQDRDTLYIDQNGRSVPDPQNRSVYALFEYVMAGYFHPGPTGATAAAHVMGVFWQTYLQPFGIVDQFSQYEDIVNADDPMTVIHDLIIDVWLPAISRWVRNAWPELRARYPPTDRPPALPNDYYDLSREQQMEYMRFHPEYHRMVAPDDEDLYS